MGELNTKRVALRKTDSKTKMAKVDVMELIKEMYIMTIFDEPTDFHSMKESDLSFIVKKTEPSFRAEDVLRKCDMNICKACLADLTMSVALGEQDYYLKRKECTLCGMIAWREPMEKICRSCCDMENLCCVCKFSPRLPISAENMPQAIMNDFVKNNIQKLNKHRQALVFKAISSRWRQFYIAKKISQEQASADVEAVLKYFLEKPEPECLL